MEYPTWLAFTKDELQALHNCVFTWLDEYDFGDRSPEYVRREALLRRLDDRLDQLEGRL